MIEVVDETELTGIKQLIIVLIWMVQLQSIDEVEHII
jgi:hypothetical protein